MLRGTNDSCSLPRHTLSQHSHPERRTRRDVSSPSAPRVTPGMNLPRCFALSLRLLLSPLLYFCSSCRSLSGFSRVRRCLCLSIYVFICFAHIHLRWMLLSWLHRLSRQWEEITQLLPLPGTLSRVYLGFKQRHKHMLDYSGVKTQSRETLTDRYMLRKHNSLPALWFESDCVKVRNKSVFTENK